MPRLSRSSLGAILAGALLASALAFAAPSGAAAPSTTGSLIPSFPDLFQEGMFEAEVLASGSCDSNIVASDVTVLKNGQPTNDVAVVELGVDGSFGLVIGPGASSAPPAENLLSISLTCQVSSAPATFTGVIGWAQIDVTKTVVGDAPEGAEFTIDAECTPSVLASVASLPGPTSLSLVLGAGQTSSIFAVSNGTCVLTETDSQGALESTVTPGSVTISSSTTQTVEVVNTFATKPRFTG